MIYQPRNVTPYNSAVDMNIQNQYFTLEMATNSAVTKYRLYIDKWDNTNIYDSLLTTLGNPLYNGDTLYISIPVASLSNGNDYKWRVLLYQDEINMFIARGNVQSVTSSTQFVIQPNENVRVGMYVKVNTQYAKISSYNQSTGAVSTSTQISVSAGTQYEIYSDFIETNPAYVLRARALPVVSIDSFPNPITTRSYTFTGTYSQSNLEPIVSHRWHIGIPSTPGGSQFELIYDSGEVYSANLSLTYDAFKPGVEYLIELLVTSQYGLFSCTPPIYFTVDYPQIEYTEKPVAELDCDKNAIKVSWLSTNDYAPIVMDNNILSGYIYPGTIGENSFYIEKNLTTIRPGDNIVIQNVTFTVSSYDANSGLLTTVETLPQGLTVGENYVISGIVTDYVGDVTNLYRNTPYAGVNSVDTKEYSLIYENDNPGETMGTLPENYDITLQFKPDANFFYGATGIFNDINPIAIIESDAADEVAGSMFIFIHKYNICACTPELDGTTANILQLGDNNTQSTIELAEAIDLTQTSYIYFVDYGYIENITSFDDQTNIATLNKELPFVPADDTRYVMLNTLSTSMISAVQDAWVLQATRTQNPDYDYRWIDASNSWEDEKYWVEGGTGVERIANHWWKVQITNNFIRVEVGGI